jgi:2,4-dienoyl-CoA reductase-like NADH-dependent reductase (Old Yellow Enzyme family)
MRQSLLFEPLSLRSVTLKNRVVMSPMCQYSASEGHLTQWHHVHYPSRAVGGVGLIIVEATAVEKRGVISPDDVGIWSDAHVTELRKLTRTIHDNGAVAGIQLAHAGRKAGTSSPWKGGKPLHTWKSVAPSAIPFAEGYAKPEALDEDGLSEVREAFVAGARRALEAGFQVLELHMAHGYLLHSFLSPVANLRTDAYGGVRENRVRFPLEVVQGVREVWPLELPLFVRVSATDWLEGGWSLEDTVVFARELAKYDVNLLDCSSGGIAPGIKISIKAGYQVHLAEGVKRNASVKTGAVGLITEPEQAETILQREQADLIFLGRALLSDPYWVYRAGQVLGVTQKLYPVQYERAFPK